MPSSLSMHLPARSPVARTHFLASAVQRTMKAAAALAIPARALRTATRQSTALTLVLLAALAQPAMAAPNVVYSKNGVSFEHPADWKVTDDAVEPGANGMRSIDLEGPDESVVTFMFSPFLAGQNIEKFAATAAKNRADSSKGSAGATPAEQVRFGPVTSAPITRQVAGKENTGVSQRFVVTLQGQNLPHEARFFAANLGESSAVIMTQVAVEYAQRTEPGFVMALDTLRYRAKR